ncbi:MAG: DUF883 family protein [Verrucomicrobiales bacterium]|nr:DUF883 family protein [Verrucomicrobiales bacterium]
MNSRYETPAAVRHDAHTLAEEARALLQATADVADEKVAEARKRLESALERGQDVIALVKEQATASVTAADKRVRENPYEAMAIAFGLGAVLSYLITRRG